VLQTCWLLLRLLQLVRLSSVRYLVAGERRQQQQQQQHKQHSQQSLAMVQHLTQAAAASSHRHTTGIT
jgi:hypothetical protein